MHTGTEDERKIFHLQRWRCQLFPKNTTLTTEDTYSLYRFDPISLQHRLSPQFSLLFYTRRATRINLLRNLEVFLQLFLASLTLLQARRIDEFIHFPLHNGNERRTMTMRMDGLGLCVFCFLLVFLRRRLSVPFVGLPSRPARFFLLDPRRKGSPSSEPHHSSAIYNVLQEEYGRPVFFSFIKHWE